MATKTDAQKKAQRAYMEKFARVEVRISEEKRAIIKAHADAQGESVNGFINRAIDETMERDDTATPDDLEAIEAARADFAAGETVPHDAIDWN